MMVDYNKGVCTDDLCIIQENCGYRNLIVNNHFVFINDLFVTN